MKDFEAGLFPVPGSFEEKFIRSGGHGGQNVNKTATAVQLRFFPEAAGLSSETRSRLRSLAGAKLTADGDILIIASEYRTQEQNRRAARLRLKALLELARERPKHRRPTKPSRASKQRRISDKKLRSCVKRDRKDTGLF